MSGPGPGAVLTLYEPLGALDVHGLQRTERIREMVRRWRETLNLLDWDIRFDPNGGRGDHENAAITFSDADKAAVISINPELDYQAAEGAVVHELLHAVLRPYFLKAYRLIVHVQDDQSRTTFTELLDDAQEEVIETITRAFVAGYPRVIASGPEDQATVWAVFK